MHASTSKTRVKSKAQAPAYRLHRASGQAVVTLNRKDTYLGPYLSEESRRRYDAAVAEWLARGRRPVEPEAPTLTVDDLIERFLTHCEAYYIDRDGRPNAKELAHIKRALEPLHRLFGLTSAAEFGPCRLEVVREEFVKTGLCRASANKHTRRIKTLFKHGVARELLPAKVWHRLQSLPGLARGHTAAPESKPIRPVADEFVEAIRPYVSRQVWAMVGLQRHTGMRPGEVVSMRRADIDTSGTLWTYKPEHHKTEHHGKTRLIMLGARAQSVIRPFLKPDLQAFLFSPREAEQARRAERTQNRRTPLSCGNRPGSNRKRRPRRQPGDHYTVDSYRKAIVAGCDRADAEARLQAIAAGTAIQPDDRLVPRWSPNRVRHSYATRVRKEFGLDAAQVTLGHSHADTTEIYAERDQALAATVAARIG